MPKTKISEFSSTPGNNTDIDGINIAEGCAPSGINDAIRELMAQLKDFQTGALGDSFNGPVNGTVGATTPSSGAFTTLSTTGNTTLGNDAGDVITVNGPTTFNAGVTIPSGTASLSTLSVSGSTTLSGGTANGVAYLNGSKVLTTGSDLTFNGSLLTTPTFRSAGNAFFYGSTGDRLNVFLQAAGSGVQILSTNNSNSAYSSLTLDGSATIFNASGGEQMRLTSTGLGIGTSSPAASLQVGNALGLRQAIISGGGYDLVLGASGGAIFGFASQAISTVFNTAAVPLGVGTGGSQPIIFGTGGTERARIDSSGNLGVGGAPQSNIRAAFWGGGTTSSTYSLITYTSNGFFTFAVRDDGLVQTGTRSLSPYNLTTGSAANMFVASDGILYRSTSSLKYKSNVQDATHGLSDLLKLRSVTYEGKSESDSGKTFGGLIAEEVHDAGLTEFVQYAEDGTPDALAYGNMVSLCIKAIQEQQAIITALTARVEALEAK